MRIERLWVDVTAQVGATWADHFIDLELHHGLDINNVNHIWLLHHLFLNTLNEQLAFWAESWNQHHIQIRHGPNRSPADMFGFDMLVQGVRGDLLPQEEEDIDDNELEVYGIDWEALRDERLLSSRQENNNRDEGWSSWIGQGPPEGLSEVLVDPPQGSLRADEMVYLDRLLQQFGGSPADTDIVQLWARALAYMRSIRNDF